MIYNYSSVLFLYVTFIFSCYIGFSMKLEVLILANSNVIRCSDYEYLIITDWSKLISSKISCPNQINFFEIETVRIYNYTDVRVECDAKNKRSISKFYVSKLQKKGKKPKLSKNNLPDLSSTMSIDNRNYSFQAILMNDNDRTLVHNISIDWTSNMTYVLSTTFIHQSIVCHIILYLIETVKDEECTNEIGSRFMICYYEPLSKSPVQYVDWTQLRDFVNNEIYSPPNWQEKGGYYLDVRLLKTTTTSTPTTTTTTITSTTTKTTTTTRTTSTSPSTVTSTTTTTTTTTTTVASTTTTTTTVTSTTMTTSTKKMASTTTTTTLTTTTTKTTTSSTTSTTTISTTVTTRATSTSSLIVSSEIDRLTSVTIDITPSITTSSDIATTNLNHTVTASIDITTTTVLSNADTISDNIVNTTATHRITPHKKTKSTTKLKPPKNNSASLKKPPAKKSSSSPSIVFVFLLILFILSIIGSILFFLFRFRRNRQNNNQSLLNRHDSEESNKSDMDESETEPSTDEKSELSENGTIRKGGRMFSQLDPDAL